MNRTAIVTGASRGIGAAIAALLSRNGYSVCVNYHRSPERAREVVSAICRQGGQAFCLGADVSDSAQVDALVSEAESRYGKIDLLVNNAAIASQKLFTDISEEEWDRLFAVDVKGAFLCSRAVLPSMISRKSGCIVNISSIWGLCGASCEVHYSAAKAALIGMTKALAQEVGPSGIRVNCVAPGVIDTEMNVQLSGEDLAALAEETPLGRIGTPAEVARTIAFLASEEASFLTGQVVSPNGGLVV